MFLQNVNNQRLVVLQQFRRRLSCQESVPLYNLIGNGMDRVEFHALSKLLAKYLAKTLTHILGGLLAEGHSQDAIRVDIFTEDHITQTCH